MTRRASQLVRSVHLALCSASVITLASLASTGCSRLGGLDSMAPITPAARRERDIAEQAKKDPFPSAHASSAATPTKR